jgi:hypothetical protein
MDESTRTRPSKERWLNPQIAIGLLTDATRVPADGQHILAVQVRTNLSQVRYEHPPAPPRLV